MKIAVLNPNSSKSVTRSMEACLAGLIASTAHEIECFTLEEGPPGIETDADVAEVAPKVSAFLRRVPADAYVVGCFSDPGLEEARRAVAAPVFGIAESAYTAALVLGKRFGVISLGVSSIARHKAKIDQLGLSSRLAGDRSLEMTVAEANDAPRARRTVWETAGALVETDGADVLLLGCAGMGEQRQELQRQFGVPVVDPVQAAVADAITALNLGYFQARGNG